MVSFHFFAGFDLHRRFVPGHRIPQGADGQGVRGLAAASAGSAKERAMSAVPRVNERVSFMDEPPEFGI